MDKLRQLVFGLDLTYDKPDPKQIAPWKPYAEVQAMNERQLAEYYKKIFNDGLSPLQKRTLITHTGDVQNMARHWDAIPQSSNPIIILGRYLINVVSIATRTLALNFTLPITDPINFAYAAIAYTAIWIFLLCAEMFFIIKMLFRLKINDAAAAPEWYDDPEKAAAIAAASKVLGTPAPFPPMPLDPAEGGEPRKARTRKQRIMFDIDVAKALLVLSTLAYSRETEYVTKAKGYTGDKEEIKARNYLLRSEELLYMNAKRFGLQVASIADFGSISGAYVCAFWKVDNLGPDELPWCVIVFKGTQPTSLREFAVDASFRLESCIDYLGAGQAHEGFYASLFPAPSLLNTAASPGVPLQVMRILPYQRIVNTVQSIAVEARDKTGGKPLQLFCAGHSLGAGMASLFFSRMLESPGDFSHTPSRPEDRTSGFQVDVRDAYLFGTPRALSGDAASKLENNMRRPENFGRMLFRVANKDASWASPIGDIVCRVPPGLCDERRARGTIRAGSLLTYAHVGQRIDLLGVPSFFPSDRHFRLGPTPIGAKVDVVSRRDPSSANPAPGQRPAHRGLLVALLPFVEAHFPERYDYALQAVLPTYVESDEYKSGKPIPPPVAVAAATGEDSGSEESSSQYGRPLVPESFRRRLRKTEKKTTPPQTTTTTSSNTGSPEL